MTTYPFDMVVVGGTGDLARRKLLPALYVLHKSGELDADGRIFAASRKPGDKTSFLAGPGERARQHIVAAGDFEEGPWRSFVERLEHLWIPDDAGYGQLKDILDPNPARARIFYLATPPASYGPVSRAIAEAGLIHGNTRLVLEKPIGHDLESAHEINVEVGEVFDESQVYRIDHYLGKETVQNLMVLRFANAMFEPLWRSEHVDHVQITVAEAIGIDDRGGYYDHAGALRDMVQNHLLQLLCLTAMEPPPRIEQDAIRAEKIKVLRALRPIAGHDVREKTVRGQYRGGMVDKEEVVGYLDEEGIDDGSHTETFVALKAEIDNWRWGGVPFYLRTGKRLNRRVSEIVLQFKDVPHVLFENQKGTLHPNRLVIRLQPDESIKLSMMNKVPGARMKVRREFLNLNLGDRPGERKLLAYERLLLDAIRGVATLFIHRDEVEEAWRWVDSILEGWKNDGGNPRYYDAGTWGPPDATTLIVKEDSRRRWYEELV